MRFQARDVRRKFEAIDKDDSSYDSEKLKYKLKLDFQNIGTSQSGNKTYYDVSITIKSDSQTLNNVNKVIYTLHKTFKPNTVERKNRNANFQLKIKIWGFFVVKANVIFNDGTDVELARLISF